MNSIGEFATAAGRRPDWWLQAAADAQRRAFNLRRAGWYWIKINNEYVPVWDWLTARLEYLLYLGEHSSSGDEAA